MRFSHYFVLALIIFLCLVAQSTFLAYWSPLDLIPDLILIVVISIALIRGYWEGALVGLFAGLALDLAGSGYIGFHGVAKMVLGFSFGLAEEKVFKENFLLPAAALFAATIIHELIYFVLASIFGQMEARFWYVLPGIIAPLAVYNGLLAPVVYHWLYTWHQNSRHRYG